MEIIQKGKTATIIQHSTVAYNSHHSSEASYDLSAAHDIELAIIKNRARFTRNRFDTLAAWWRLWWATVTLIIIVLSVYSCHGLHINCTARVCTCTHRWWSCVCGLLLLPLVVHELWMSNMEKTRLQFQQDGNRRALMELYRLQNHHKIIKEIQQLNSISGGGYGP